MGYWPKVGEMPFDPADEIRRRSEIMQELKRLRKDQLRLKDPEQLLKEIKKQRMADSRARQKENKERRERERLEKTAAWKRRMAKEVVYLGEGVSGGLNEKVGDSARLEAHGLPVLKDAEEIAKATGLELETLRFLAFSRDVSTSSNYIDFEIKKKTGGVRKISAPKPSLKLAQYWILEQLLEKVSIGEVVHGFCKERSIVTNATPHIGRFVVVNIDLEDFFPTITYPRVKGLFKALGYSESAATVFALLCTESEREEVSLDGKTYFVAVGDRKLPQGAPTSPAISNLICRTLDKALTSLGKNLGFTYTRYADDLTFSAADDQQVGKLLRQVRYLVGKQGFLVNEKKTKVIRKSRRQEVTGIVVNEKLSISRKKLKAFRAVLYQIAKDGPKGKRWGNSDDVLLSIQGYANFIAMVDPEKGRPYQEQVQRILTGFSWTAPEPVKYPPKETPVPGRLTASKLEPEKDEELVGVSTRKQPPAKKKPWWKFW